MGVGQRRHFFIGRSKTTRWIETNLSRRDRVGLLRSFTRLRLRIQIYFNGQRKMRSIKNKWIKERAHFLHQQHISIFSSLNRPQLLCLPWRATPPPPSTTKRTWCSHSQSRSRDSSPLPVVQSDSERIGRHSLASVFFSDRQLDEILCIELTLI